MPASISARNSWRVFRKSITFAAGAGTGDVGTVAVATTTGTVQLDVVNVNCSVSLAGASATIVMGVATSTNGIIAQATGTALTAGLNWAGATPAVIVTPVINKIVTGNIIITIATAGLTAGTIEVEMYYRPATANGFLA